MIDECSKVMIIQHENALGLGYYGATIDDIKYYSSPVRCDIQWFIILKPLITIMICCDNIGYSLRLDKTGIDKDILRVLLRSFTGGCPEDRG